MGDIDDVFVYIDDITIASKTLEEHKRTLLQVLKRLNEHGMKINFEKTKLFQTEIEVLGYKVNAEGIYPKTEYLNNKIFFKTYAQEETYND